jgi:hypothetical protein
VKIKNLLVLLAAATIGAGAVGLQVNFSAERVANCEVAVNKRTLDILLLTQHETRRAVDLAELRLARRFYSASGQQQPALEQMIERLGESLITTNNQAQSLNEDMQQLLERGCRTERGTWIGWSLLFAVVNTFLSCLAFWLGLLANKSAAPTAPAKRATPLRGAAKQGYINGRAIVDRKVRVTVSWKS